jgi:hypothetical protein
MLFLVLGACYPLLRIEITEMIGVPSPVLGAWVDVVSFALLATMFRKGSARPSGKNVVVALIAFVLAAGIASVFASDDPIAMAYGLRQTYVPMIFFFVGLRIGNVWSDSVRTWNALTWMAGASAVVGLLLTLVWTDYWTSLFLRDAGNARDWGLAAIAREKGFRMTGAMLDPVVFGTICAWGVALSVNAIFVSKSGARTLMLALTALVCLAGVVLSLSRGAWFGATLAVTIGFIVHPSWIASRKFLVFALFVGVGMFGFVDGEQAADTLAVLSNTLNKTLEEGNQQRQGQFDGVLDNLPSHPFGNGLGKAGHVGERFSTDGMTPAGYPHITDGWYLKLLAEGGVMLFVAFMLFLVALLAVLARGATKARDPQRRALLSALLGIYVATVVQAVVSNVWDLYFLSQLLWFLAGLGTALARQKRRAASCTPPGRPHAFR